jgi:hypothetical protein
VIPETAREDLRSPWALAAPERPEKAPGWRAGNAKPENAARPCPEIGAERRAAALNALI